MESGFVTDKSIGLRRFLEPDAMTNDAQTKILAQAVYEIRLLLAGYLGSQNDRDPVVRRAAHLAYALHNEALTIIEGGTFDVRDAVKKVEFVDKLFNENYFTPKFEGHISPRT